MTMHMCEASELRTDGFNNNRDKVLIKENLSWQGLIQQCLNAT